MSHTDARTERHAASVAILAGALATAGVYVASDYVTVERTVAVASIPVVVAGLVAAGAAIYWRAD
ncbi:hypothetical protein HZS55_20240 [Halosimplex rubrum]|uniref:Uncharacterized protein n=1 Tax=Halosimplex rubrum TaxID=869889 RepID=A0A7D5P7R8_9EURY|nr:hypothetical protein [Halosimplex rubrum]QLH79482.1 hypothetical protein HZS55_20240 [Halosimplex rubrum]